MFEDNIDFYPTPENLSNKMISKIDWSNVSSILEPSAGKGDLAKNIQNHRTWKNKKVFCIEKDERLQHILRGEDFPVIDSDFLSFASGQQFDAIIMNPPFSNGHKHLLKAIEIMYSGQIVCLLNSETIKNPYSRSRKELIKKLEEHNASIEFLENQFIDSERKTSVEIALIYINIKRNIEDDLFRDVKMDAENFQFEGDFQSKEIASANSIERIVEEYNKTKRDGIEFLQFYYKNKNLHEYLPFENRAKSYSSNLTETMKETINSFIEKLRKSYWLKLLDNPEFNKKLTERSRKNFSKLLNEYSYMEYSEVNIYTILRNISMDYIQQIEESTVKLFDDMTRKYAWTRETDANRLHYLSWKSNDAYKVSSKVILPWFQFFDPIWKRWNVSWDLKNKLDDIDKVMNFFEGKSSYVKLSEAIEKSLSQNITKKIESEFFIANIYKKGTLHLTFKSEDVLRRFNIFCGKQKGWLPDYYAARKYEDMDIKDKNLVASFEEKHYYTYINENLIKNQEILMIA